MRWRVIRSMLALGLAAIGVFATGLRPAAFAVAYLAAVTPWLIRSDIREHRLPNLLVLPGIAVGALAAAGEWVATGRLPVVPLIAATAYAAFLLLLNLIGGMGMGDVKLAAALGLASWTLTVAVLAPVVAFLAGGAVATVLLIAGQRGRRIAFGPYLLGGYWVAVALEALANL